MLTKSTLLNQQTRYGDIYPPFRNVWNLIENYLRFMTMSKVHTTIKVKEIPNLLMGTCAILLRMFRNVN